MFDIFSKFGEIKEKAENLKNELTNYTVIANDISNSVEVEFNGKKDLTKLTLKDSFTSMTKEQQEKALVEAINKGLDESEVYVKKHLKDLIPNIPGMNLFS